MEAPLIQLLNISKSYRTSQIETLALSDVNFEINQGDFIAVMGPSGCGKSTLLNIIGLIDRPNSGDYLFAGHRTTSLTRNQLAQIRVGDIGFIFQSSNLIDELTVFENVELPLAYKGIGRKLRKDLVRGALELVNLSARSDHLPYQLSGGQQQRVAIARAFVGDPKLILADEPTGNLDSRNGEDVMEILKTLNEQGAAVLMVTHSQQYADEAQRTVRMLDGRINLQVVS